MTATAVFRSETAGPAAQNFTIIVNWKDRGFGCAKACSYCNWRSSPMLPHGPQSMTAVSDFIAQCRKSFITISGGGDPLYRFEDNEPSLRSMAETIRAQGFKVRIITREIQHVSRLQGIVDFVSISLDDDVLQALDRHQVQWGSNGPRVDLEFSLVLPPLPVADLVALKPQYAALHRRLGRRLVLRENFNSIFPLSPSDLTFGHSGIVFVPKSLCLDSRYLSTIDCSGHDIVQDHAALVQALMNDPNVVLFGGLVKHLINPAVHLEYSDIDAIALDASVMTTMSAKFGFEFKETSSVGSYPRYFQGRSVRAGKDIQLVLMQSLADAERFIFNAQYSVDRAGYNQRFMFDPMIGEVAIREAINSKAAHVVPGPRSLDLFHSDRALIEQRHKSKLIRKGFIIIQQDASTPGQK
jgi:hypothetical protein